MSMFPFEMPDEVLNELMDMDMSDMNAEYYGHAVNTRFPSLKEIKRLQREQFSASDRPRVRTKQPQACPKCGHQGLMYVDDDHLYYTSGKLAGKLHGCA